MAICNRVCYALQCCKEDLLIEENNQDEECIIWAIAYAQRKKCKEQKQGDHIVVSEDKGNTLLCVVTNL